MKRDPRVEKPALRTQLLANQLWETVAFIAKAVFLLMLTPLMLKAWGPAGYGEFAVASSIVVFVTIFDFGIRGRLRADLAQAQASREKERGKRLSTQAACVIACASLVAVTLAAALAAVHFWSETLNISRGHESLIVITTAMAALTMLSGQLLEPLVAKGRLGELKLAGAIGSATAIPVVWLIIYRGGSQTVAVVAWLGLLCLSNAVLFIYRCTWRAYMPPTCAIFHPRSLARSYRSALSINLISISGITKTHGLTFMVSIIAGPATAGIYFIFLRLAEIISSLGAASNDLLLAQLPRALTPEAREESFCAVQRFSFTLTLLAAGGIALFTPCFLKFWLKFDPPLGNLGGLLAALYGLSTAFRHTACNAGAALSTGKLVAIGTVTEVVSAAILATIFQVRYGIAGTLIGATVSAFALIPAARFVARSCGSNAWRLWLCPWASSSPSSELA